MHERGTYGNNNNGYALNGYAQATGGIALGAYGAPYGYPVVGADPSSEAKSIFPTIALRLSSMLLGGIAGRWASESKDKGLALGVIGGYVASILLEQTSELKSINRQLQSR